DTLSGIMHDTDPEGISVPLMLPGVTDARFFSRLGIQTYGFMPMALPAGFNFFQTIHAADERIPVEAVAFGTNAIFELLQRYKG
ncbi:MAG: peptidase M20, partial [Proteobacteria bacterium]|nr:peptidase M20 [Pseudomonadota bacterium]